MNEEEKTVSASRLGKEAKIGVAVIVGLLLIFAGVVAMRMLGGSGNGEALAANTASPENAGATEDNGARPMESEIQSPTVLETNSDSAPPHGLDRWRDISSDSTTPNQSGEPNSQPLPPAPLPSEPSKAPSSDPMAGFAMTAPPPSNDIPDAGQARQAEIIERPPSNPMRQDYDGTGSLTAPPPLPPYREPNGPGNSDLAAPSPPDRSYDDSPAQSTPATPISRYGAPSSGYTPPDNGYSPPANSYTPPTGGYAPPASPRYGDSDYRQQSPPPSRYDDSSSRRDRARQFDGPPPLREDGKYEIQPLDSFWTISEKFFGTGAYFKALEEHNRDKIDADGRLAPGDFVVVPTVEQLEKSYPDLCPKAERREIMRERARNVGTNRNLHRGRTYKVNEGDTLFDIARYELGKAARWVEIYELNRDVLGKDFNYLTPGIVLVLPDNGRPDVLAEPPDKGYRR